MGGMEQLLGELRAFEGVLELAPGRGSPFPEIAWGDHFFYYAPSGEVPQNTQPYATIVTKDYPGDALSRLGPEGRWRVNIHVGRDRFEQLTGLTPRQLAAGGPPDLDYAEADVVLPHPVYGSLGWVAVVVPGERTTPIVRELLRAAHRDARRRAERREP